MKDGIIRGEGNSRLLRSPATIPATFAEFRAALIAGTLPVDLLYNATGWDVQGTALNKANLLTDAVAEALGLESDDPTVSEALGILAPQGVLAANAIPKGLATGADQALVSTGVGAWAVKTLAQIKAWLGLGSAAYTASTAYATAAQGTKADNAIAKQLATAADQVLVSSGSGAWGVQTKTAFKTPATNNGTASVASGTVSVPAEGYTLTIPHGLPGAVKGRFLGSGSGSGNVVVEVRRNANISYAFWSQSTYFYTGAGTDTYLSSYTIFGSNVCIQDAWLDDTNIYITFYVTAYPPANLICTIKWEVEI